MKEKKVFYCELAYIVGIVVLALGTAFMEKADFGMSMIVAPAYIIYLKVSQSLGFFTFGMSEYIFQLFVLFVLAIVMRKFKKVYILSFATTLIYGVILDNFMKITGMFPYEGIGWQIVFYVAGLVICATGIALLFRAHYPPEAYELFVKEIAEKYKLSISKVKTIYDCYSCVLAIVLSLAFFGTFVGVKWGTIICALVNGWLIGRIGVKLDKRFEFVKRIKTKARL